MQIMVWYLSYNRCLTNAHCCCHFCCELEAKHLSMPRKFQYLIDHGKQKSRPEVKSVSTYFIDSNNVIHRVYPRRSNSQQPCNVEIVMHLREFMPHKKSKMWPLALERLWGRGRGRTNASFSFFSWSFELNKPILLWLEHFTWDLPS
jgi:hypothetical protein